MKSMKHVRGTVTQASAPLKRQNMAEEENMCRLSYWCALFFCKLVPPILIVTCQYSALHLDGNLIFNYTEDCVHCWELRCHCHIILDYFLCCRYMLLWWAWLSSRTFVYTLISLTLWKHRQHDKPESLNNESVGEKQRLGAAQWCDLAT